MELPSRSIAAVIACSVVSCGSTAPLLPPPPMVTIPAAVPPPAPPPSAAASAAAAPAPPSSRCAPGSVVATDEVEAAVAGSFSAPNVDEIVGMIHCDPDGNDLGGLALLRRTDGVLKTVRFDPLFDNKVMEPRCAALRTSEGRDLAICRRGSARWGWVYEGVVAIDYARPEQEDTLLVSVVDQTGLECYDEAEMVKGILEGFELLDVDHDGHKDVQIKVRAAKIRVPRQLRCETMGSAANTPSAPLTLPRAPRMLLDFRARGTALVPTPATVAALKKIEAMAPRDE